MTHKDELMAKQEELKKALAQLEEELVKSDQTDAESATDTNGDENLETLLKSLEAEAEALEKSMDGDADDKDGDSDPEPADNDKEDEDADDLNKSDQQPSDLLKSIQDALNSDQFQMASEAYEALEKSVNDGFARIDGMTGQIETLSKSIKACLGIQISTAKCLGELVKSVQEIGAQPVGASRSQFGVGSHEQAEKKGLDAQPAHMIQEALEKAVNDKKVDSRCLSIWGTHRSVERLPNDAHEFLQEYFKK